MPPTEPEPPISTSATTVSDPLTVKSWYPTVVFSPANRAPENAASAPETAKTDSRTTAGASVAAAARRGSAPTAIIARPAPDRRSAVTANAPAASAARQSM